jgi:tetratricopeptide (TPR) repeat protein
MNANRHYDDETLIALMEAKGDPSDSHLPGCETCTEKLESVRMIAEALRDETVWNEPSLPVPATIAFLRAAATQMEDEDAQADVWVGELLEFPRSSWASALEAHPEYRTAGMVRKLVAASDHAIDTVPADAVEITSLAVSIADALGDRKDDRLAQLRGAARREKAFALYYTGRTAEAMAEAERAEAELAKCVVGEYERARLGIVKSLIHRVLEQWTPAGDAAREAVRVFDRFDDLDRTVSARLAEVQVLFSMREFDRATAILLAEEQRLRYSEHVQTHARVLVNLGYAYWQRGKIAEALGAYDASSEILRAIGIETEALRARWGVATMLADAGQQEEALSRLREISEDFETRGMQIEAALARLGIAELILGDEKFAEVEEICRRAIQLFERAGVSYTARALTALAYMREATANRRVTPKLVRHVRDYIQKLPREENLLFAPL